MHIDIERILLGSPYKFHVDSLSSGGLTAYGPGLTVGKCGEPCVFTISTKNASGPLLSLSVEGPSKAKVNYDQEFTHSETNIRVQLCFQNSN